MRRLDIAASADTGASRTYAAMFGDSNGSHGVYSCRLESDEADMPTEAEGLWSWFDGGSLWWWKYRHNVTLCAVAGIPDASHTLVLSVQPSEVYQGIAVSLKPRVKSRQGGRLLTKGGAVRFCPV